MIMNKQRTMQSIIRTIRETETQQEKNLQPSEKDTQMMCDGRAPYLSAKLANQGNTRNCLFLCARLSEFHTHPLERSKHFRVLLIGRSGVKFHLLFAYRFVETSMVSCGVMWQLPEG